jgi:hypothetical protein
MPRTLPPDYFAAAPFAAAGSDLFRSYTCLGCGARAATWAAFRAHRWGCCARPAAAALVGERAAPPAAAPPRGGAAGSSGRATRDPFLDAPAAALRRLEAWRRDLERAEAPEAPGAPARGRGPTAA